MSASDALEPQFGRFHVPDARDQRYPAARTLAALTTPTDRRESYYYRLLKSQPVLSQVGGTCVGHGCYNFKALGIVHNTGLGPYDIYDRARQKWPGIGTELALQVPDGTTVRAGMQVLQDEGVIGSYLWAHGVETVIDWLLRRLGPVVIGVDWYTGMLNPTIGAEHRIHAHGVVEGGHCVALDGANANNQTIRILNSWGPQWGYNGHAYLSFDDLALLLGGNGEAAMATEHLVAPLDLAIDPRAIPEPLTGVPLAKLGEVVSEAGNLEPAELAEQPEQAPKPARQKRSRG